MSELKITASGDYSACYHDDDIFLGHTIVVTGTVVGGPDDADIEG